MHALPARRPSHTTPTHNAARRRRRANPQTHNKAYRPPPPRPAATFDKDIGKRGPGAEGEAAAEGEASAEPAPEFGYIVDYRESDGMYRIVFDDIKDAEDANYWYKRGVDWYKRGEDFEVL